MNIEMKKSILPILLEESTELQWIDLRYMYAEGSNINLQSGLYITHYFPKRDLVEMLKSLYTVLF